MHWIETSRTARDISINRVVHIELEKAIAQHPGASVSCLGVRVCDNNVVFCRGEEPRQIEDHAVLRCHRFATDGLESPLPASRHGSMRQ